MSYFKHHVFFCTNQRESGKACCENFESAKMRGYAKQRIKALGMNGEGGVRINTAGCLDRCEEGPVIVIYPEEVWYSWLDESDIDEIIEQHLKLGKPVKRLMLP
jgi:(2Fe-2S) ferredoxin